MVVYFHGGGWVLGDHESDEPLCRDLSCAADAVVVSVNYRHGPEARFPAAAEDAFAAVQWVAGHAVELGGIPGDLAVAGLERRRQPRGRRRPAGPRRRRPGHPRASSCSRPVTDADLTDRSYVENAEGYVLTGR